MAGYSNTNNLLGLANLFPKEQKPSLLGTIYAGAITKRKAFFSFHFDDVLRVNVVRNAWKITHPDNALMRSFYDSSLWESKKLESAEALKKLIREGVSYTSTVCVLVGSETWARRWVRYEIARAIIDGRGLLAVHLNSIKHHQTRMTNTLGLNPLSYLAVGKVQKTLLGLPQYYLFERSNKDWDRYQDHTAPVSLPSWLADPADGYVTPLSSAKNQYDYITQEGHKNIGFWINNAAIQAGR